MLTLFPPCLWVLVQLNQLRLSATSFSSFILCLADHSLSQLYLKYDTISSPNYQHILNSFTPYLLDFKYSPAFLNIVCRVLISRGLLRFFPSVFFLLCNLLTLLALLMGLPIRIYSLYPFIPFLTLRTTYYSIRRATEPILQTPTYDLKTIMLLDVEPLSS